MLKIYTIEKARKTILRRETLSAINYPDELIAGVEKIFGQGTSPHQAVERILSTVSTQGDAALQHWSK
ncbi:MAG: hypothetical protein U9Q82_03905, partial [Chloroflexota bacterium]|nr:hypothetical protein [Chloroflexota bacterium]